MALDRKLEAKIKAAFRKEFICPYSRRMYVIEQDENIILWQPGRAGEGDYNWIVTINGNKIDFKEI